MAIALLDINDCNLQLWSGTSHLQSPGYALLDGKRYHFGNEARAAARLRPRDINTRFWWQLSTEALQPALGPARHTGDLVHAQLQELHAAAGQPDEMLLAVSGTMAREQLALLLGIVQQCSFEAVGLVNRSVALASLCSGPGRLFHLEIQLHQAVLAELTQSGGRVELSRTAPLPGCGMLQLQERLVEMIAAAFIRQTRFDPRRKAATEQQLYDALPAALRALQDNTETNLEINGYQARIGRGELLGAGQRLFESAADIIGSARPDDRVIADPVAGLLPGLAEQFPHVSILAGDSMQRALAGQLEQLVRRDGALQFVTSLPCLGEHITATPPQPAAPASQVDKTQAPASPAPTHLLENARARPLVTAGTALDGGWVLYRSDAGWCLRGDGPAATVNGDSCRADQVLHCGDTIRIGTGPTLTLIEVAP